MPIATSAPVATISSCYCQRSQWLPAKAPRELASLLEGIAIALTDRDADEAARNLLLDDRSSLDFPIHDDRKSVALVRGREPTETLAGFRSQLDGNVRPG